MRKYKIISALLISILLVFVFTTKTYSAPEPASTVKILTPEEIAVDLKKIQEIKDKAILTDSVIDKNSAKEGEIASCFDYYTFGSVGVSLTSDFTSYEAGSLVLINGKVKNNNKYPIIGVDIKARLVKNIPSPIYNRSEIMILEDFDISSDITLKGDEEIDISHTHLLPLNAPSGEYGLYFYVVEKDRFNLSGLSFTNDIVASSLKFEVIGKNPDHIYLDQTKIKVGGDPHNVMGFITSHAPDTDIPVEIPLYNPEAFDKEMKVTYTLYSWDSANLKNKIYEVDEKVNVPAKSQLILSHIVKEKKYPVYYLNIKAEPFKNIKDKSVFKEVTFSNIRFARYNKDYPRLNFTGVDKYPLKKDIESTLVTCFHNIGGSTDKNITRIETVVLDKDNKELAKTVFEGMLTSQVGGLIQKFIPKKDFSEFTVLSKMYNASGEEVDLVEKVYKCEDLDPESCPKDKSSTNNMYLIIFTSVIAFLVLIGIILFKIKTRK